MRVLSDTLGKGCCSYFLATGGSVKLPETDVRSGSRLCENSAVEFSYRSTISILPVREQILLATSTERRRQRKPFCASSALPRFHTAWVMNGSQLQPSSCGKQAFCVVEESFAAVRPAVEYQCIEPIIAIRPAACRR